MEGFRDALESDFKSILALNDAEVQQTSPMDSDRLLRLVDLSAYCKVATVDRQVAAFLIAIREGAPYESENYAWFSSRFPTFLYIDRIVVGSEYSGRGIGGRLYDRLFAFSRSQGVGIVVCEYNLVPPNPASRAFHAKFGFREIGTQWVAGGTKQVSLQVAQI